MTPRVSEAPISRQKRAAENMSKVQRLHRALQSGPIKSELRTLSEAIHAARALYKQIQAAGIEPKDFAVHIAYLTPDLSTLFAHPFIAGQEAVVQAELSGECCIMAGLTFGLRDHEHGNWIVAARPFLKTPLVEMALDNWLKETVVANT
jgi:hypothetical protein